MLGLTTTKRAHESNVIHRIAARYEVIKQITGENMYHAIMTNSTGENAYANWDTLPADYQKVYIDMAAKLEVLIRTKVGMP